MPKPRQSVRIIDDPNGSARRSDNDSGRGIHGLTYDWTSKPGEPERGSYYTIESGKRKHRSRRPCSASRRRPPDASKRRGHSMVKWSSGLAGLSAQTRVVGSAPTGAGLPERDVAA